METVYKNDWMQIYKKDEQYIIQYNSGDLINSIMEIKVSEEDALEARKSDKCAYEIILKNQNQTFTNYEK